MSDSILKQEEIAQYISDLYVQIRQLKRDVRLASRTQELSTAEEPQDVGGALPFRMAEYFLPTVKVTEVTGDTTFKGKRQQPDASGWTDDAELTTELECEILEGGVLPLVDDVVPVRYTGNYGTGASIVPRYGLLSHTGLRQMIVKSQANDYLVCNDLDAEGGEGTSHNVMKPWLLRQSPFNGQTVNGVSYTYSSFAEREATPSGGEAEDQVITQDYFADSVIMVGVMNVYLSAGGTDTNLIDVNDSGRAWAVPLEEEE